MVINKKCFIWIIRAVLIALIIMWMSVIFGFSSENGEESQSFSDRITIKVVKVISPDYEEKNIESRDGIFNKVSFFVRKTGHFGEYAILGILFATLLLTFEKMKTLNKYNLMIVIIVAGVCMLYAASDEFHQGFVAGRSPKIMDVCIDTCGGTVGAAFVSLVAHLFRRQK